jgi:hypothetical protein
MTKMAQNTIDQQIIEGRRVCKKVTKSYNAEEQLMEQFWLDVPDMLRECALWAEEMGKMQKRASTLTRCVPIVEHSWSGGKTTPVHWSRIMDSRYERRRSRSPELKNRCNEHAEQERNYAVSLSRLVSRDTIIEVTERMGDTRLEVQEGDVFVTTVQNYLEGLMLDKVESNGNAASKGNGSAGAKGQG